MTGNGFNPYKNDDWGMVYGCFTKISNHLKKMPKRMPPGWCRDDIYHIFRFLKVFSIHFWVAIYINPGGVVEFKL
jgi:hypothetical protein